MRIGMYNRWLATLGGGEKHSLVIAEYLSKKHQVTVISHKPVDKKLAAERFNFDLSRVEFITIPERSALQITPLTAEYDFFINASYMDFFPSLAKHSAALIFFPGKLNRNVLIRRELKHIVRSIFKLPALIAGVMSFDAINGCIEWQLDVKAQMELPASLLPYTLTFEVLAEDSRVRRAELTLDGQPVKEVLFTAPGQVVKVTQNLEGGKPRQMGVCVDESISADGQPKLKIRSLALSLPQFQVYRLLFEKLWRGGGIRLQYFPPGISLQDYFDTYDMLWANSEFTRKWIRRYWARESEVLYPPVDVDQFHPAAKKNYILNVGRFFAGQHNKKHHTMIHAFREMVDAGLRGWELHLVGGVMNGEEHAEYYAGILKLIEGYPIIIHPDLDYSSLLELYAQSAIYWHASGHGEDENQNPDKFEHFGITTIEAMAAGCVPVVIGKGGQPEIVRHGENGFLWQTTEQLQSRTRQVIADPELMKTLSGEAMNSSRRYDQKAFSERLQELLGRIDPAL